MKLFRKFRMDSANLENVRKYFSYAIGEILLVMIGILLALQINNWNQNRQERIKETKSLTNLLEEFKVSKNRIEEKQQLRLNLVPKLDFYVNDIFTGKADNQSFYNFHTSRYIIGMTNPSNGVIDGLISSSQLSIISNDSLKYLLSDWKDQVGNLRENELILWDVTLDYSDYYQEFIIDPAQNWKDWDEKKLNDSFSILKDKIAYRNKLVALKNCNKAVITECESILSSVTRIISLLERELKK